MYTETFRGVSAKLDLLLRSPLDPPDEFEEEHWLTADRLEDDYRLAEVLARHLDLAEFRQGDTAWYLLTEPALDALQRAIDGPERRLFNAYADDALETAIGMATAADLLALFHDLGWGDFEYQATVEGTAKVLKAEARDRLRSRIAAPMRRWDDRGYWAPKFRRRRPAVDKIDLRERRRERADARYEPPTVRDASRP